MNESKSIKRREKRDENRQCGGETLIIWRRHGFREQAEATQRLTQLLELDDRKGSERLERFTSQTPSVSQQFSSVMQVCRRHTRETRRHQDSTLSNTRNSVEQVQRWFSTWSSVGRVDAFTDKHFSIRSCASTIRQTDVTWKRILHCQLKWETRCNLYEQYTRTDDIHRITQTAPSQEQTRLRLPE